ncbi:MAG: IS66 family insertion sequence element accessory protein TnpB [Alphaproteobacteria bacterium]
MIVPGQRTPIVIATRPVDFRRGHAALAATVQNELGLDPHSGLTVVFRSKRMDRVKILVWDGTGLVLTYKRLDAGAFAPPRARHARGSFSESDRSSPDDRWPQVKDGVMRLTRAQFEALFDGLDWRRVTPRRVRAPAAAD